MGRLGSLALAFLGLLLLRADAQPERRVALVIGNATYEDAGPLANPLNDAADLAAKLRDIGFEVIEGRDLGKRDLERKIGEFSDALEGAGTGLFFYAGHGLQVDGRNYIVPVDARLDMPAKLRLEAVPMDDVIDIIEQQARTSIVFLDACRNNPFVRSLSRSATTRSASALAGLAQFDSTRGSFIAFSTAPGAVAMDGTGRNSPFASALLKHIAEPGQSINDMMIEVRRDVIAETHDFQRPWEQGSLIERFEFVPAAGVAAAAPRPAVTPPAESAPQIATLERSVGDAASIESFLREQYLAPDAASMQAMVKRLYTSPATIYGTAINGDALAKVKTDWFAQWSSWTLSLEPGSLKVTPRGEDRADAVFAMSYDYVPKDAGAARASGRTRVTLGLIMRDGEWRITSETSEALP
jgi:uncharacterized caspase-like protein